MYVRIIYNICFYAKSVLCFKASRCYMDVPEIEYKHNATKQFVEHVTVISKDLILPLKPFREN